MKMILSNLNLIPLFFYLELLRKDEKIFTHNLFFLFNKIEFGVKN